MAGNKRVGLVKAQELVQPAGGSRAEVRPGKEYCRNTEVDRKVHGYGVDGAWEHMSWSLRTVI